MLEELEGELELEEELEPDGECGGSGFACGKASSLSEGWIGTEVAKVQ